MIPVLILLFSALAPFFIIPFAIHPVTFFIPSLPAPGLRASLHLAIGFIPPTPTNPQSSDGTILSSATSALSLDIPVEVESSPVANQWAGAVAISLAFFALFCLLGVKVARRRGSRYTSTDNARSTFSAPPSPVRSTPRALTEVNTPLVLHPVAVTSPTLFSTSNPTPAAHHQTLDDAFDVVVDASPNARVTPPVLSSPIRIIPVGSPPTLTLPLNPVPQMKFPWIPKRPVRKRSGVFNLKPFPMLNLALLPREDDSENEHCLPQTPKPGEKDATPFGQGLCASMWNSPAWAQRLSPTALLSKQYEESDVSSARPATPAPGWKPESNAHQHSDIMSPTTLFAKQCAEYYSMDYVQNSCHKRDSLPDKNDPFFRIMLESKAYDCSED